jgi:hypothetical protein
MVPLACTGTGLAVLVTDKSAELATCTVADALLLPVLGSLVEEETDAVSVMVVPDTTVVGTFTTKEIVPLALRARLAMLHVYGAVVVHVHPDPASETNVAFVGTASDSTTALAVAGPLLVTVCV